MSIKERKSYEKICEECNVKFVTYTKATKLCSQKCVGAKRSKADKHRDVELICIECNKSFIVGYIYRQRKCCSTLCTSIHANKNKSKESIERQSEKLKNRYKEGSIKNAFKGKNHTEESKNKTKKTRKEKNLDEKARQRLTGIKRPDDVIEKMSKGRTAAILSGKYASWFKKGEHFSCKLNKAVIFQSSWEEKYFKFLDNDDSIITYNVQPFSLEYWYTQKRRYIPDILITYITGQQKLIEIKPSYYLDAEINKAKFVAAIEYCKNHNMTFEVWTEKNNPYDKV